MSNELENAEQFETKEDRTRRIWAEAGADWAYFVVRFLQGKHRLEVQPSEIVATQTYQRSDDLEKYALQMVCESDHETLPSPDDEQQLRSRDQFLVDFVDGRILGHADLIAELRSIPKQVAERQRSDAALFAKVWKSPTLFSWIWEAR